jgi:hypothetical protein
MIRTVLSSWWFPLSHWLAALAALLLIARHQPLRRELRKPNLKPLMSALAPTAVSFQVSASTPQANPTRWVNSVIFKPVNYWSPRVTVFRLPERSSPRFGEEVEINKNPVCKDTQSPASSQITTLSVRAGIDPSDSTAPNMLEIQCRTEVPISNARRRNVTIHGVVTQDVVSSKGKILIMAGSRVVGRAAIDPENGRLKSNGPWTVFSDNAEITVQARLLDGIEGMAGILGQATSTENEALQREAVARDGRYVFVRDKASFALKVCGNISLRDVKSKEASN